jgi:hypothetical protein
VGAFGLEPIASSSADDAFKLVCGQRERARRQVQDLEVEMAKLAAISHGHQAEARRLQADNLKLYEKVKFLQSTVAAAGHSRDSLAATPIGRNSIEEQATEGRYQKMYEEKVNPFAAFHQRERQQRYAELPAPEKLMLNFSQFFLANRHARLFLFGYMVCLHLLVSGSVPKSVILHVSWPPSRLLLPRVLSLLPLSLPSVMLRVSPVLHGWSRPLPHMRSRLLVCAPARLSVLRHALRLLGVVAWGVWLIMHG